MFEQVIYFYERQAKPCYIIKAKGKSSQLFSGDSLNNLQDDLRMLPSGRFVITVANSEKGFNNAPEYEFDLRASNQVQQQNQSQSNISHSPMDFKQAIQEAYEQGKKDLIKEQDEKEKTEALMWLYKFKPQIEKMISALEDDDPNNDEQAKTGFLDAMSELPDMVSSLETIINLNKTV